jgi:hypothetical protein
MCIISNTPAAAFLSSPQGGGIALQSLSLDSAKMLDHNLLAYSRLFDLSRLKALSIDSRTHVPWREFAPHVTSIEELDVVLTNSTSTLAPLLSVSFPSASAFPNLTTLRIPFPLWIGPRDRPVLAEESFAGLTPSASITANVNTHGNTGLYRAHGNENIRKLRTLVFSPDAEDYVPPDGALCTLLDEAAVELGVELELEVDAKTYARIWPFFPRLQAVGAVRTFSVFYSESQTLDFPICFLRWTSPSDTDMLCIQVRWTVLGSRKALW